MHIAAAPTVTLILAAACGLINLWLGVRVSRLRQARKINLGHGGDSALEARMRAQANFTEYVPLALILILLIELNAGASRGLWLLGAVLVVGRVLHPIGMDRPSPNPYRMLGIACTLIVLVALVIWAVLLAYGIVR